MSLQLDARQRAMLAEMGVRVFLPEPGAGAEPAAALAAEAPVAASRRQAAPAAPGPRPAPPEPLRPLAAPGVVRHAPPDGALERTDWEALERAVHDGGARAVVGSGDRQPQWLIVGEPPGEEEEQLGEPFAGAPGKLLDNMLAALGLNRREQVYLTNALKCRLPPDRAPQPAELAQGEAILRRQVQLLRPRVILAMGRFAAQALLQTSEPLGRLRGRAHEYDGVPLVVTYHPAYLLRNLPDKGKAWADLCFARALLR